MPDGPSLNEPASRSRIAPNTLGESIRGRHSHSIAPPGATSAVVSQSDRKPYSAIGGNGLPPSSGDGIVVPGSGPRCGGSGEVCGGLSNGSFIGRSSAVV